MLDLDGAVVARLRGVLPQKKVSLLSVHTPAVKCRKLVFTRTADRTTDTRQYHRFVLSSDGLAFLAVELVTYVSATSFTLFVCKADTSGYVHGQRAPVALIVRALIQETLRLSPRPRVRVCLFAKSLPEYLFLGSKCNPAKHILPGADLVKWWLRVLDDLKLEDVRARLRIPGLDDANLVARYFPPCAHWDWQSGDIFEAALAVNAIPRFPDDPKHRLLDAIVDTGRAKQVSPDQFFMELEAQQEFRLQKSVGIIGVEGNIAVEGSRFSTVSCEKFVEFETEMNDLDFSTEGAAREATRELFTRWKEHCVEIEGTYAPAPKKLPQVAVVQDLSGAVRKKRKVQA